MQYSDIEIWNRLPIAEDRRQELYEKAIRFQNEEKDSKKTKMDATPCSGESCKQTSSSADDRAFDLSVLQQLKDISKSYQNADYDADANHTESKR